MKQNFDHEDALLNAILRDENWRAEDAELKRQALGVFYAKQRHRRMTRWGIGVGVVALFIGAVVYLPRPKSPMRQAAIIQREPAKPKHQIEYMTDAELLAAFPPGSCVIAEVNGQAELVFLRR